MDKDRIAELERQVSIQGTFLMMLARELDLSPEALAQMDREINGDNMPRKSCGCVDYPDETGPWCNRHQRWVRCGL